MDSVVIIVILGSLCFLIVPPPYKVLAAFVVSLNMFNLAPSELHGIKCWDIGALLFFVATIELYFRTKPLNIGLPFENSVFLVFMGYLLLVFLVSLFQYPVISTIQAARQMVLGYCSIFTFSLLFRDDRYFDRFLQGLFWLVFAGIIVHIIQYFSKVQILAGYQNEYLDGIRSIPVFIYIAPLFFFAAIIKFMSGIRPGLVDIAFAACTTVSFLLTFTRGIYLMLVIITILLLAILSRYGRLRMNRLLATTVILYLLVLIVVPTGLLGPVFARWEEGVQSLGTVKSENADEETDTFSMRLLLLEERMAMIEKKNPITGFGFIHEEIAKKTLRWRIGTGDRVSIGFASGDIAWANLVIYTGYGGTLIFSAWAISFLFSLPPRAQLSPATDNPPLVYMLAAYLGTLALLILMLNSSMFTTIVQIPCFTIAAYRRCRQALEEHARTLVDQPQLQPLTT